MEERRSGVEVHKGVALIGLPQDVKQYPLEGGWLLVSTVGMCFVPYPKAVEAAPLVAPEFPKKGKFR